jgi:hypothetical protein
MVSHSQPAPKIPESKIPETTTAQERNEQTKQEAPRFVIRVVSQIPA